MAYDKICSICCALIGHFDSEKGVAALIGEAAPPLIAKEWVTGQPVEIKPGTNFYVLEILQGLTPACLTAITNLDRLQAHFETNGVVVVGVSEDLADRLKRFLQTNDIHVQYSLAADNQRQTAKGFLAAIQQHQLPYSFIIGTNATVYWHGYPASGLSNVMAQILGGNFDVAKASRHEIAAHQMQQYIGLSQRGDFRAKNAGQSLLANRTNDMELLCDMAYRITAMPELAHRDLGLAGQALDEAEQLPTTNKLEVMTVRAVWLFESGKHDAGLALLKQTLATAHSPQAKANVQLFLDTMEAHLAAQNSRQTNTATVAVPDSPAANTNDDGQGKSPSGAEHPINP